MCVAEITWLFGTFVKFMYGTVTSEEHRPSLQKPPARSEILPFSASVEHARNTNMMIQCEECELWRLIYFKYS